MTIETEDVPQSRDALPTLKEANACLAGVKRLNRLRREAEGRAYHRWLDDRLGIARLMSNRSNNP